MQRLTFTLVVSVVDWSLEISERKTSHPFLLIEHELRFRWSTSLEEIGVLVSWLQYWTDNNKNCHFESNYLMSKGYGATAISSFNFLLPGYIRHSQPQTKIIITRSEFITLSNLRYIRKSCQEVE